MPTSLVIIVPCYNEEAILEMSKNQLVDFLNRMKAEGLATENSKICFVDDGSKDQTWALIDGFVKNNPECVGLKLSKNFGHQSAILAGMMECMNQFEAYITIDADLQDDVEVMREMLIRHQNGAKVVYGVRNDRSNDTFFKRFTAETFYKLMLKMGVPIVYNHADFRLMDNIVVENFSNFKEVNLFIRGIIPTIGFKSEEVYYQRLERQAGETKYPLTKMLAFAWKGITSFSTSPMRMVLWFGAFNFLLALLITVYVLYSWAVGKVVIGWASTLLPMAYFSGSNMIAIGLIGEYLGRVYEEIKGRPRYIIEKRVE
ncbi:glycosyltransferase family 2 protein [Marinilongibacter aquaticus]|uniref:glycosyltransferase family 2 protein n=1 Tax=Marinilongibacter aquaticus TaxID=2975157 RepID=UPI0021BDA18C|nr:glycosyltransferase family 2 protein [Marinilongibacter aquaticus]UBM58128.1 glycosyltransferase family 2 protein [Marinilongibacter aquaticus]